MFQLPTQVNTLYLILAIVVAITAVLLAIILRKSQSLDTLKEEFNRRELRLNQKLYETAVLKNKLEAMVEGMSEGVFMLDKDFKLLVVNPACKDMLGISRTKRLTIFDLVRGFSKYYPIEETISQVFETGEIHKVSEVKVNERFLQITVLPVEVAEGVPGVGVLLHDQTEEQKLRHQHEEFMAMMVHELRSPLTVVKGTVDLLKKKGDTLAKGKRDELLDQVKDSAVQLLDMVNTVLEDTKEDSSKYELHKEVGKINELLENEIRNYEGLANERSLTLEIDLDDSIPEVEFDWGKITQVMNNLLSNAIKFTHEGGISVVSSRENEEFVKVEVKDTGEGIPDKQKPKLFQKFVQLHKAEDADLPGTGLGLVIAKGIIEAHGGKIWVEDNSPRGTTMIFTLPLSA
jgi:signal transduction histidine kinase